MKDSKRTSRDSEGQQKDRTDVLRLESGEWYEREELANRLNVSLRTVSRRLKRGEIVKKDTPNGPVYRPKKDTEGQQKDTKGHQRDTKGQQKDTQKDRTPRDIEGQQKDTRGTDRVSLPLSAWTDLIERLDQKNARISELEREVGRKESISVEDLESLRNQLIESRAREHVARGRRELAEERLEDRDERIGELEAEVAELRKKLEDKDTSKTSTWSFFSE